MNWVVVLSDSPRVSCGAQAFYMRDGMVVLLSLECSDKAGRGFPEVSTPKSLLYFFWNQALYQFIDFFKLSTGSMSATNGVLSFLTVFW